MAKPELVGYDAFYLKELNDLIDIKQDYTYWRTRQHLVVSLFIKEIFIFISISFRIKK